MLWLLQPSQAYVLLSSYDFGFCFLSPTLPSLTNQKYCHFWSIFFCHGSATPTPTAANCCLGTIIKPHIRHGQHPSPHPVCPPHSPQTLVLRVWGRCYASGAPVSHMKETQQSRPAILGNASQEHLGPQGCPTGHCLGTRAGTSLVQTQQEGGDTPHALGRGF